MVQKEHITNAKAQLEAAVYAFSDRDMPSEDNASGEAMPTDDNAGKETADDGSEPAANKPAAVPAAQAGEQGV